MEIDGACHCGKVSFTALIDPDKVMVCHCNDCQVLSGAPMRAVVPVMLPALSIDLQQLLTVLPHPIHMAVYDQEGGQNSDDGRHMAFHKG